MYAAVPQITATPSTPAVIQSQDPPAGAGAGGVGPGGGPAVGAGVGAKQTGSSAVTVSGAAERNLNGAARKLNDDRSVAGHSQLLLPHSGHGTGAGDPAHIWPWVGSHLGRGAGTGGDGACVGVGDPSAGHSQLPEPQSGHGMPPGQNWPGPQKEGAGPGTPPGEGASVGLGAGVGLSPPAGCTDVQYRAQDFVRPSSMADAFILLSSAKAVSGDHIAKFPDKRMDHHGSA